MTYNMFDPITDTRECVWKKLVLEESDFSKSDSSDALLSPVAIAVRKMLIKSCDVLATSKQILFYSCKFDRKNVDIVLGQGRILTYTMSEEVVKDLRDYETTGEIPYIEFMVPVPKILLDPKI